MEEVLEKLVTVDYSKADKNHLTQVTTTLEYALLDDKYTALYQPFFCKDYFNEIVATEIDGKSRAIYGFKSEKLDYDLLAYPTFKIALQSKASSNLFANGKYVDNLLRLLNKADNNREYIPTTIELTTEPDIVVLTIDIKWLSQPVLISLYTLLIRLAYNYDEECDDLLWYLEKKYSTIDSSQKVNPGESYSLNNNIPFIEYLFNGNNVNQTWEEYLDKPTYALHNNSGLCSYFQKFNKDLNKIKNGTVEVK